MPIVAMHGKWNFCEFQIPTKMFFTTFIKTTRQKSLLAYLQISTEKYLLEAKSKFLAIPVTNHLF